MSDTQSVERTQKKSVFPQLQRILDECHKMIDTILSDIKRLENSVSMDESKAVPLDGPSPERPKSQVERIESDFVKLQVRIETVMDKLATQLALLGVEEQ